VNIVPFFHRKKNNDGYQQELLLDSEMFYLGDLKWIRKSSRRYVRQWYAKQRLFFNKALSTFSISKFRGIVLNLGCGGGALSCLLSNAESLTIGIDISAYVVKNQRTRARYHGLTVEGIVCDGSNLPLRSDTFEFILSQDVIEHTKNPFLLISEAFRVLAPGGSLFFSAPNKLNLLSKGHSNWKNQLKKALCKKVNYERLFTSWELKKALREIGFKQIDFVSRKILFPFQMIFLRRGWIVLARK